MALPPAPNEVVDAIVAGLAAKLGAGVEVRAHDGAFGDDGKELVSTRDVSVLVFCDRMRQAPDAGHELDALAHYVAVCISHKANPTAGQKLMGDVAMDLAAMVQGIVQSNETWGGAAQKRAASVSGENAYTNKLRDKGLRVWGVQWWQEIRLRNATTEPVYNTLNRIDVTFAMGGDDAPDAKEQINL